MLVNKLGGLLSGVTLHMAKIRNANPKSSSGGYERLVGDDKMAAIFMKAQSTVISNGTELENIITKMAHVIVDLDDYMDSCDRNDVNAGVYLCTKKVLKKSKKYNLPHHEPDFLIFTVGEYKKQCYVVELKDGDSFDTKKSSSEKEMLQMFTNHLAPKIPFRMSYYICSFNQNDKEKIVIGFKSIFNLNEVMTGREFCQILNIDYDEIVRMRRCDTEDNFKYVIEQMAEIKDMMDYFKSLIRQRIVENDFYLVIDE